MGNNFFRKEIFWGGNFGEHVLEEQILLGRKFCQQNFWRIFLRVKSHSGEDKDTGKQKCFGGKIWGAKNFESKFLPLMVSP